MVIRQRTSHCQSIGRNGPRSSQSAPGLLGKGIAGTHTTRAMPDDDRDVYCPPTGARMHEQAPAEHGLIISRR
jgi:hypothetical protein